MLNRPQASSQRARRQLGIMVDGESQVNTEAKWYDVLLDSQKVGDMTCRVWTCRLKKNTGYTLVSHHCAPGDHVEVVVGGEWIMYPPDTAIED